MIFSPDMLQAVLEGRKTQTRRPVKPHQSGYDQMARAVHGHPCFHMMHVTETSSRGTRIKYATGQRLAIQPGRGARGVGHIDITAISLQRICDISDEDARAEGFADREGFFAKWRELYGKNANLDEEVWVLTFVLPGRFE